VTYEGQEFESTIQDLKVQKISSMYCFFEANLESDNLAEHILIQNMILILMIHYFNQQKKVQLEIYVKHLVYLVFY
jgi:hypothetical protein